MTQLISRLLTFLLIPSFSLYSLDIPVVTIQPHSINTTQMLPDDYIFTYDDVLDLIEELEEGDLEKRCSFDELARINQFLARLAAAGRLPDTNSEELERDINELLINSYEDTFSFAPSTAYNYLMAPAFFSSYGEISLCKGWFHKTWDQTKHFTKKHKKAILIGVAIVVAVVVVVGVAAAVSAGAAAAAGAAASDSGEDTLQARITTQPHLPLSKRLCKRASPHLKKMGSKVLFSKRSRFKQPKRIGHSEK